MKVSAHILFQRQITLVLTKAELSGMLTQHNANKRDMHLASTAY